MLLTAALTAFAALVGVAAGVDFVEPASSPEQVGIGPQGIVAADLDGDGDSDLATANVSGGNATILKNNGNGNFFEPVSSPEPAGSFPDAIEVGDLDGDGDQDLVVANQVSNDLTILKNNGNGNFFQPATSPESAGNTPVSVAVGDVDGDSDPDLAVANAVSPAGVVTILKNNGNGNFGQPASSPEPAGTFPQDIVAADLDGDGDRDLATANQGDQTTVDDLTILLNNGSADFLQPPSSPERAGSRPLALVAANLSGDGLPDVAVANSDDDNATIFRNFGAGDFREMLSSPEMVGDRPGAITAADFNGDNRTDLAVADSGSSDVTILRRK